MFVTTNGTTLLITTEECQAMYNNPDKEVSLFELLAKSDLNLLSQENKAVFAGLKKIKISPHRTDSLSFNTRAFVKKLNKELKTIQKFMQVVDNPKDFALKQYRKHFYFQCLCMAVVIFSYYYTHKISILILGIIGVGVIIGDYIHYLKISNRK